jgi:hypothetical protein
MDALGPTRRSLRGSLAGQTIDTSPDGQLVQDLTALWLLSCAFLVFFMQASVDARSGRLQSHVYLF